MNFTIEKEKSVYTVKCESSESEWQDAVTKAYQKTKGNYKVPGFRPGKAPKNMIEQMYGDTVFTDDAVDIVINDGYFELLTKHTEIDPIDRPQVEINDFNGEKITFTIKVSVKPDIKLGAYKGIKLSKIEYNVSQTEIDDELSRALERSGRIVEVDRASKSGDTVNIDYSGAVDNVKFDGGTAEKYNLVLGSNSFIPGFEDQLIGHKAGEEVSVNVTFPSEYHAENLKGKNAVFTCKINSVSEKQIPALDDAWASESSQFDTLDEYKADIKSRLEKDAERREKADRENAVINSIVDSSECDLPEVLVENYLNDMLRDVEMRLSYQGLNIADYFKYTGTSEEQFKSERREEARRGALTRLVLEELISTENITVSDDEAESRYYEEMSDSKDKSAKPSENDLRYIKNELGMEKLMNTLLEGIEWTDEVPAKKSVAKKPSTKKPDATDGNKAAADKKTDTQGDSAE